MKKFFGGIACMLLLTLPSIGFTQDLDSLLNLSAFTEESELQKVLNQNLTVSSSKALTTRETPGIISLITSEEIQNSGARDLIDILRLVPGFDVAQDLSFVIGLSLRGSWANEGKVLVMMDGQPFNDLLYQGVAFGNHFPVDAIERIEIIRGPGSAIYGGSAEYGVINIITKAADKLNGVQVYGTGGFHSNATGRTNAGFMAAQKTSKVDWDFSVFKGRGIVSDQKYNDPFNDTTDIDLTKATYADPFNINAGLRLNNLHLRVMYDNFETSEPLTKISFENLFVDLKYDWKIGKKLTLTPQLRYLKQNPWNYENTTDEEVFKAAAERKYGSVGLNYVISRKVNFSAGAVYFSDKAENKNNAEYFSGKQEISLNNMAVFGEGLFKHRLANATLGFRYEKNNKYGDAFVPRFALTKKIENFHFKILYSQAFRAPAIENINLAAESTKIKPEKSRVFEVELGYQFTPEMLLAVNAFNFSTKNVIVYGYSTDQPEGFYSNYSKSGSKGIEVVYSIRKKNWYSTLTYSFNRAGSSTVDTYVVPQTSSQFVAMPAQKITLNTNFNITKSLTFNPTFIYTGTRYAYTDAFTIDEDEDGEPDFDDEGDIIHIPVANKLDGYLLANVFINYKNIVPGLTAGLGVYDLLNKRPLIPQAYNGEFSPLPSRSREIVIKLSYALNFK